MMVVILQYFYVCINICILEADWNFFFFFNIYVKTTACSNIGKERHFKSLMFAVHCAHR